MDPSPINSPSVNGPSTNRLHSHFETLQQQEEAATLGMWVFLATEVLFFGVLFMGYTYVRWSYPLMVEQSSRHLELGMGTLNTAVLLTSSFIVAAAVLLTEAGNRRKASWLLAAAAVMGVAFLVIKGLEYHAVISEGYLPGYGIHLQSKGGASTLFFWLYFVMTGVHALHVVIGVGLLGSLAFGLRRPQSVSDNVVRNVGLYWHFVDLVWVFLFPMLYLAGHRPL
jgi:cytochrome c oxidase subunit 3